MKFVCAGLVALAGIAYMNVNIAALIALASIPFVAALWFFKNGVFFLGKDDQLRVVKLTETVVFNGPEIKVLNPLAFRSAQVVKAESLGTMDYVKVKDTMTGQERIERGPKLLFLHAYDEIPYDGRGSGMTLSKTEYLIVEDQLSGDSKMVKGPTVWYPETHDKPSSKRTAIPLQDDEYLRIADTSNGQRFVKRGKDLVFVEPTCKVEGGIRKVITLKANELVRLLDSITGKISVIQGENTVVPGPHEEMLDGGKMSAIDLLVNEYVKIQDQATGENRVEAGPQQIFLGSNDKILDDGKKKAVQVDDEHAVLVRDLSTGQLKLVVENQLYVPGPNEYIDEVRQLYVLADHEAVIIKDKDGNMQFHYGDPQRTTPDCPRSFFLPPHAEVVRLQWSGGMRRLKRDLKIERFDMRPQFMWNEIDCRTSDNVELVLETTLFWEVEDLAKMVRKTGNLTGDIYNQLRSQFIKHVAKVTLKKFMEELHKISATIFGEDAQFYDSRGVKIHSLEVTKYTCSEKRTSEVLQQIIEETTNRLNRLSQAESENEVKIFKMQGQIEQEKLNGELLAIQHDHSKTEASVSGAAEAERCSSFLQGLEGSVPKLEDRMQMWQVLRKTDALSVVSQGGASLYYTPNDVNLSIKTDSAAGPTL